MRDVARAAGVSLSTVSRVVNGLQVDELMAGRVHEAVARLGYRHNVSAASLRRTDGQTASVGLIVEDVANPFFSAIQRGVEDVLRSRRILTFSGSSDEEPERERELAEAFAARGVDGLIIAPAGHDQDYLERDRESGLGLVFVDRPPATIEADHVLSDNYGGAAAACRHLIAYGHRRIGFIGDRPEIHTAAERHRGYRETIARNGLAVDRGLVPFTSFRAVDAYQVARELLLAPDPPTALLTSQNLITEAVVQALHDLDLHDHVALVGFDDVPLARAVRPALTVMAQDPRELGRRAAELLLGRLDGFAGPARRVVLPVQLIERGSGEIGPTGQDLA